MNAYLIRLFIACWFVGMVAFAVWGKPTQGEGLQQKFLPIALRHVPVAVNPDLRHYLGLLEYGDKNQAEIYTVRADGSELTRLTLNAVFDTEPRLSPDGTMIAFLQGTQPYRYYYGGSPYRAMMMKRDGSDLQPLMSNPEAVALGLQWSPVRNDVLVAFASSETASSTSLAIVSPTLGTTTVVAENVTLFGYELSLMWGWSPDGQYIYYHVPQPDSTADLWLYSIATQTAVQVVRDARSVAWHPSGSYLVVRSGDDGDHVTELLRPDGTLQRTLFTYPYEFVAWAQHGSQILAKDRLTQFVYKGNTLSGTLTPFIQAATGFLSVSPGNNLVFYQATGQVPPNPLYVQPLAGGTAQLVEAENCAGYENGAYTLGAVTWAYDGSSLLFSTRRSERDTWYMTCYMSVTEESLHATLLGYFPSENIAYLPYSSEWAMSSDVFGYPPPHSNSFQRIHTQSEPSSTIMFPGAVVVGHEWRYLPEEVYQ